LKNWKKITTSWRSHEITTIFGGFGHISNFVLFEIITFN
jgi:hypothetical protein